MTQLFVYGTLKRGKSNHHFMAGQRLLGEATTSPAYRLFLLGSYPGMVADPAAGYGVEGEVWEVDDAALAQLDRLEGTAEGLYARVPAALPAPWSGVETYLYLRPLAGCAELGPRFEG